MYIYEGEDYSKLCSEKDRKSFDELLAGEVVNNADSGGVCVLNIKVLNMEMQRRLDTL